jgi:hypothetical protein
MTKEQRIRLLRAKANELEGYVASATELDEFNALRADVALLFIFLADQMEASGGRARY